MSSVSACPLEIAMYFQTGDDSSLPLLCHYPVKVKPFLNSYMIT